MNQAVLNIAYIVASILFIWGLKGLTHPRTAIRGNLLGATGMLIAIVATLFSKSIISYELIILGLIIGSAIGTVLALKIRMTAMPQLVALFNGFGGGASLLVAGSALIEASSVSTSMPYQFTISTSASGLIGAITFWGSLVAFAKLEGLITGKPVYFRGHHFVTTLLGIASLISAYLIVVEPSQTGYYWILAGLASVLGILLVIPIGGADMPVVISLLNSYSGLAASATGFVLNNNVLIIAGSLVGASGIILTRIMCKAMNRSLYNVLFGLVGVETKEKGEDIYAGKIKATSAEEVAMLLESARLAVIVPGYGMAVAQAQHAVKDLMNLLESKGVEVQFAIHPVAGRMPGHMNVLLAEADVPYDKLKDLESANSLFPQTDVAIVIGANDVVNPLARTDPRSPIAGMPILDVDRAKTVVIIKRSLSPGFAGIPNPLFAADNTLMFFEDGKKAILEIISALKE